MVYAIGTCDDGTRVVVCGLTDDGIAALRDRRTLTVSVPPDLREVATVVFFAEPTMERLYQRFAETGVPIYDYQRQQAQARLERGDPS
jgi:DNA primase